MTRMLSAVCAVLLLGVVGGAGALSSGAQESGPVAPSATAEDDTVVEEDEDVDVEVWTMDEEGEWKLERVRPEDRRRMEDQRRKLEEELRRRFEPREGRPGMPGQPGPAPRGNPGMLMLEARGQEGSWEIVQAGKHTFLLNGRTGETFVLRERDDRMKWEAVERPQAKGMPGIFPLPEGPRPPKERRAEEEEREREHARKSDLDNMRRALDMLREKVRGAKDKNERRRLEDEIEELEEAMERLEKELKKDRR